MTHFEDGPAKDKTLMLKRSPLFLRVVTAGEAIDALDQLEDKPEPHEKIYAYERFGEVGMVHINCGRKNHGGFFPVATYRMTAHQPEDADMRDTERWKAWTRNAQELKSH